MHNYWKQIKELTMVRSLRERTLERTENFKDWQMIKAMKRSNMPWIYMKSDLLQQLLDLRS